ncbi:hypothetical protein COV20_03525 [Candidatus Woesearchaeota archaeon CG10_big_fil_rev_8_21_14_0_10_45_16]|nr:MAG: hypothetical protein COV20_03525 [Candidatus Woesearchaeota archaeon CG10_big_fil_rev_8_21_14_0_10_45_16]
MDYESIDAAFEGLGFICFTRRAISEDRSGVQQYKKPNLAPGLGFVTATYDPSQASNDSKGPGAFEMVTMYWLNEQQAPEAFAEVTAALGRFKGQLTDRFQDRSATVVVSAPLVPSARITIQGSSPEDVYGRLRDYLLEKFNCVLR